MKIKKNHPQNFNEFFEELNVFPTTREGKRKKNHRQHFDEFFDKLNGIGLYVFPTNREKIISNIFTNFLTNYFLSYYLFWKLCQNVMVKKPFLPTESFGNDSWTQFMAWHRAQGAVENAFKEKKVD